MAGSFDLNGFDKKMALGWNVFRYLADFSHLFSVVLLLYKMLSKKTCVGVSLKTHLLYLVVFLTRYLNPYLFDPPIYNIFFKFFYMFSSILIVVLMYTRLKKTYEKRHDTFKNSFVLISCIILAFFTATKRRIPEIMNAYSLWVEAFAILPQLFLLMRSRKVDVLNREYIFFLSIYRLFYLLNWIYKAITDTGKTPLVVWITGIIQTGIYSDFIYIYIKMKVTGGGDFDLPF